MYETISREQVKKLLLFISGLLSIVYQVLIPGKYLKRDSLERIREYFED